MSPLPTIRQFIRGVCALPKVIQLSEMRDYYCRQMQADKEAFFAANAMNVEQRERIADLERQMADVVKSHDMWHAQWREVQQQLTSEREAHAETTKAHGDMTAALDSACRDRDSLRAQLDEVTRWRNQSEEPCPLPPDAEVLRRYLCSDFQLSRPHTVEVELLGPGDEWRYIDPPNPYAGEPPEEETA